MSCLLCLTVIWFLSGSLCLGHAQIWTNEVSGVQYGQLGSNVTLACGTSINRTSVVWRLNKTSSLPHYKVTHDGSLVLLHVDQSAKGNYSCYDNHGLLLHSVRLLLGNAPGRLRVSCRVPSHILVRCSWEESKKTFLPAQYHASYGGKNQASRPCVVDAAFQRCDITMPTMWQATHSLNITESGPLGSFTTIEILRLQKLLKPDPPERVSVEGRLGKPTVLMVSWHYPSSWPNHSAFPLMFQIRYRPEGFVHWSQLETTECSAVILDALVGHPHQVQVRAQDEVNTDSQWSDWSPLLKRKPWEDHITPETTAEPTYVFPEYLFPPETSTTKSKEPTPEDGDASLGLMILLVMFSLVIFTSVLALIVTMWVRQKRRDHVTKQELTSMVKMKSVPI